MKNSKQLELEQVKQDLNYIAQIDLLQAQLIAKIKTPLTAKYFPKTYENPVGVSLTIPDQTMSLQEILNRYSHGIPMNAISNKTPIYTDNENALGIPIEQLDFAERQQMLEQNTENIAQLQNQLEALNQPKIEPVIETPTTSPPTPPTGL